MAPDGRMFPKVNWMKSGFIVSDLNITVSPNYAKELVSGPGKGAELDGIIRSNGGTKAYGDLLSEHQTRTRDIVLNCRRTVSSIS